MRTAALILPLLAACSPPPERASGSATTPARASAPPPSAQRPAPAPSASASPASAHACAGDGDCTNSCAHGAVNLRWWQAQYPGGEGCEDGCTSKGTDPPRCEAGACVAYAFGKRAPECTRVERPVPSEPGPAHRCQTDADCRMSCSYGAVNKGWYERESGLSECKDGCAEGNTARCRGGLCTAMAGSTVDAHCTRRSIHAR
jgi:hypothetical protein